MGLRRRWLVTVGAMHAGGAGKRRGWGGMDSASGWSHGASVVITPVLPVSFGAPPDPPGTAAAPTWPVPRGSVRCASPRPSRLERGSRACLPAPRARARVARPDCTNLHQVDVSIPYNGKRWVVDGLQNSSAERALATNVVVPVSESHQNLYGNMEFPNVSIVAKG